MNNFFMLVVFSLLSLVMNLEGSIAVNIETDLVFESSQTKFHDEQEVEWQELGEIVGVSPMYVDEDDGFIGFYYTLSNKMHFLDEGITVKGRFASAYSWRLGDLLFITSTPAEIPFRTAIKVYNANLDETRNKFFRVSENCNPFDPFNS